MIIPATNLLRQHYHNYGHGCCSFHGEKTSSSLIPTLMAEEASGAGQEEQNRRGANDDDDNQQVVESSTTSRELEDHESHTGGGWLQLGIGSSSSSSAPWSATIRPSPQSPMVSPVGFWDHPRMMITTPPAERMVYGFPENTSSLSMMQASMRVVSPPRRPQAGVWFALQAAPNQVREPFLPQTPKSFLRIKDDRVTVRLLIKYLANKLGLEDESEVEITCRGQQLLPDWMLRHVRDSIWCRRRDPVILLPDSQAVEHVMTLFLLFLSVSPHFFLFILFVEEAWK